MLRAWEGFLKVEGWKSGYASVDLFLRHYGRKVRSEKTKENCCLALKALCEFAEKSPDDLVELTVKDASTVVQDHVDSLAERDYSVRYVNVCLAYLKTFFRVNGFKGSKVLDVERLYQPSRYRKRKEYIPSPSEIFKMAYSAGSLRNRALIFALYTSGFRNSTLRALNYGDVREELEKGLEIVRLPAYPEMKKRDVGACKGNIPYYSFISQESVEVLRDYLAERREVMGSIGEKEPLFASDSSNVPVEVRRRTLVMKKSLEALVKKAARNAGIREWKSVYPHCLRKAFESALRNAGLDLKDQEFLMGHILPGVQDAYYDKTKVDDLRVKYAKVRFFPDRSVSDDEFRRRQVVDLVKVLGYSEDRIKQVEEALAKYENVDDALEEIKKLSLGSGAYTNHDKRGNDMKTHIRIVRGEQRLIGLLNEDWDLVRELSEDRFLLRKRATTTMSTSLNLPGMD